MGENYINKHIKKGVNFKLTTCKKVGIVYVCAKYKQKKGHKV